MDKLITRTEAAELLRKPVSWLRYAERRRLIRFIKVGQQIRYRLEDLLAFLEDQTVHPEPRTTPTRKRSPKDQQGEP